jgi:hypothetical protein
MASTPVKFAILAVLLIVAGAYSQTAPSPQILGITCDTLETTTDFQLDSISVNGSKKRIGNLTEVGMFFRDLFFLLL